MSRHRVKPADVILDLLRGARTQGRTAAYLIETGALFGINENTLRVTLSRLQTRGTIESPARGRYRLTATADPINDFVDRWRLGEARVTPWDGRWLFIHLADPCAKGHWAIDAFGFRPLDSGLNVRPANLNLELADLKQLLCAIGLPDSTMLIEGRSDQDDGAWQSLWPCAEISREYRAMTDRLGASAARLDRMDLDTARIETFQLGGEAIHLLAKDPLLPSEFVDTSARHMLWQTLRDYDIAGQRIWATGKKDHESSLPIPRLANEV